MSSHVSVTISGKRFRIACEEGQEPRLTDLAAELDRRIGKLRESYGDIGDRLVIMAALTLADELTEAVARVRRAEAELTDQRNARSTAAESVRATQAAVSAALVTAAERIETMARRLNQSHTENGSSVAMG